MHSNLLRLFVIFALSFSIHTVSAYSRHRHTFFFDEDVLSSLTEETIQNLEPRKIRVKNFTGAREWKVLAPLDDFIEVVLIALSIELNFKLFFQREPINLANVLGWKVRVQIASGGQGLSHPFNVAPTSGIHIGISFDNETFSHRLNFREVECLTICKYLDVLFGNFICDSGQPLQKMVGRNAYFKEYNRPSILDFDLRFDEETNQIITDLRVVWNCKNQDIYIIKENEQDKVELGVFGQKLDSETFLGEKIIIDKDDNNSVPTMITASHQALSSNLFYFNSSVTPAQGFHHSFKTSITLSASEPNCEFYILHIFPNSFLVDTYQINELFSDSLVQIFGETDLENPVGVTSLKWGSVVLAKEHILRQDNVFEFSLPFRMRYQPANSEGSQTSHVVVSAPWPLVVYACEDMVENGQVPLFAPTPLPLSLLFPPTTKLKYILPKKEFIQQNICPSETVRVPVGQLDHLKFTERWSIFFALIGCAWVIWTIKRMQIRYSDIVKNEQLSSLLHS
ncbi:8796_t:CDS:2 [Cetraspora pellucida]|uniref:Protein PBN1 n=1 Tax=Cetraspora pellucida TaxID=1433469 RepID=A0A9N9H6G9_9GLOM|nr:8796_t:CDS:2 [Cetraspora pellucida]